MKADVQVGEAPSPAGTPALEMRGIRKRFPGVVALDGVDLALHPGEVHVLVGENGAGKSTLIKILGGACRKDSGEILVSGRPAAIEGPGDARALGIRIIYQELSLVRHLSVAENVFLGAAPTRLAVLIDWPRLEQATARLLGDLGLDIAPRTPLDRLSLAERQMVEIAKALAPSPSGSRPSVLVMDEPTSSLTSREVDRLFALIDQLRARGVALVYITHRLDEIHRVGQRVTVLRDGRRIATTPLAGAAVAAIVRLMAGRDVGEHFPRTRGQAPRSGDESAAARGHAPSPELLRVEHAGRRGVLTDISFTLRRGEILGIGGLVGAGRTELARVLAGVDRLDSGRILLAGSPVALRSPSGAIRRGIGLLPEDRRADGLVGGLTVSRNIALPHGRRLARLGWITRRSETTLAEPAVRRLHIKARPWQEVRLLSGGNQQKVVLGKWVAGDARVFIFDEPTRGVDVGAKIEIYQLMNRLTEQGAGIVMISSELPELLGMSDRILVMHRGRIQAELDHTTATDERVLRAALGLPG